MSYFDDDDDCAIFCKDAPPDYRCPKREKSCECCTDCKWLKLTKKERYKILNDYKIACALKKSKESF